MEPVLTFSSLLYISGNSFPSMSSAQIVKKFTSFPPGPNWYVRFDLQMLGSEAAVTSGYPKLLMICTFSTLNYLPMFQINKGSMSLYTYFSSNGVIARRFPGINLTPHFGGPKITITFRFQEISAGVFKAKLNFNNELSYTLDVSEHLVYEDVWVRVAGSSDVDFVVSDLILGEE